MYTGRNFTWQPRFTDALERLPEGERGRLMWAVVRYGTYEEYEAQEGHLGALMILMADIVDREFCEGEPWEEYE